MKLQELVLRHLAEHAAVYGDGELSLWPTTVQERVLTFLISEKLFSHGDHTRLFHGCVFEELEFDDCWSVTDDVLSAQCRLSSQPDAVYLQFLPTHPLSILLYFPTLPFLPI